MANNIFGYIRISTADQNDDRQRIALQPYNIPAKNLYSDKMSGKNFDRPGYQKLLRRLSTDDILYIKSIDRLGRDYDEIIYQWRVITREKKADIKVLDMPLLDTSYCKDLLGTFISDLVLQIMSFTAQLERENILQRQAEGIAAAKAKGVQLGRKKKPLPDNFNELYSLWRTGEITSHELATMCDISRRTLFYRVQAPQNDSL